MTLSAFEREITGLHRQGIKYDLDRMHRLCDLLGHPERKYKTLHVAGTNGKGSTAAFLASILQAAGYRVGLNTSPHLVSFRERIRVDGWAASDEDLHRIFRRVQSPLSDVDASFFEAATMLAFLFFAEAEVDIAVVEVGLGGRLDATNVIEPAGAVITALDLDHTRILGSTIAEIAREKGGIIKGGPVVTAAQQPEARAVLTELSGARGAELTILERGVDWDQEGEELVADAGGHHYRLGLVGEHQAENAALALTLCRRLHASGAFTIGEDALRAGLAEVRWPGRFDVRHLSSGTAIFDVAHNPHGARALARALADRYRGDRPRFVIGMLNDKPHAAFLEAILPVAGAIWTTTPEHDERRLDAEDLAAICRQLGASCRVEPSPGLALTAALTESLPVVVTGSLFTVGAAMAHAGVHPAKEAAGLGAPVGGRV